MGKNVENNQGNQEVKRNYVEFENYFRDGTIIGKNLKTFPESGVKEVIFYIPEFRQIQKASLEPDTSLEKNVWNELNPFNGDYDDAIEFASDIHRIRIPNVLGMKLSESRNYTTEVIISLLLDLNLQDGRLQEALTKMHNRMKTLMSKVE